VQVQPSSAGQALEVLSGNAADTVAKVFIEGLTTDGLVGQNEVTLTGTTPVAIGTYTQILRFGKAYPSGTTPTTELTSSAGEVTLRVVGGATLQTLRPRLSARDHQQIVLSPVPDGVYTIGIPILRGIETINRDAAPLPPNWTNAVFDGMVHFWRVSDHDVSEDASGLWPSLKELIEYDNAQQAQARRFGKPFRG
jgi:hypothetical protein